MKELKAITDVMRIKLREPFPEEAKSKHPTKTFLTTLKAMYVVERLNDVFGVGRWCVNTEIVERTADYVTVKGKFKSLDYEVLVSPQFGGHQTTGTNTEIADGYKSAVTDCISKIASHLEVGIDVFKGDATPPKKKKDNQTNFETREITQAEVDKWNGKIYAGNSIFINNKKVIPPKEQIEKLKKHPKYKPDEKK